MLYDHARAQHVQTIRSWVSAARIMLAGRYSEWEYDNSDHAFVAGRKAAEPASQWSSASFTRQGGCTSSGHAMSQWPAAAAMPATASSGGPLKPAA